MVSKTGRNQALGCAVLAAVLSIAAVTLTPIGPIFVYGWLVPIISPVIPKPENVPSRANAAYQWKGFGLIWNWEDRVSGGCAQWFAAEGSGGPIRGLDVFEGGETCGEGQRTISRLSFEDHMTIGTGENEWPYAACPFNLSEVTVSRYLTQIGEMRDRASGTIETRMLEEMRHEIMQIDRLGLRAEQYGCRVGPR